MKTIEYLSGPDAGNFIREHAHADVQQLILNPPAGFKEWIILLGDQIISRKKTNEKLPDWAQVEGVVLPPPISIEQASSLATAKYKAGIFKGNHLIDLTGGMGVDLLAIGHGFSQCTYVEQNEWLCSLFKHNSSLLSDHRFSIVNSTANEFLEQFQGTASFYLDPGRRDASKKIFQLEDYSPNVLELLPQLDKKSMRTLIKTSPMMDIQKGILQLGKVVETHVVSVHNECKEVLHLREAGSADDQETHIVCVNIEKEKTDTFRFTYREEREMVINYTEPVRYLYDPNTSLLKAGAFKSITRHFPVHKIAPNTHLYTSSDLVDDFPGRIFEIVVPHPSRKELTGLKANVMTKNYPLKAEKLKKKFKVKDGGDLFLIGFRLQNQEYNLLMAQRLK